MGIRVAAGDTSQVHIQHIDRVKAGEAFVLDVRSYDEGGNLTDQDSITRVNIALPFAGFHFGFANGVTATPLAGGGVVANIRLEHGQAQVPVTVTTQAGNYAAQLTMPEPLGRSVPITRSALMVLCSRPVALP